jgi:hypothetical protein
LDSTSQVTLYDVRPVMGEDILARPKLNAPKMLCRQNTRWLCESGSGRNQTSRRIEALDVRQQALYD